MIVAWGLLLLALGTWSALRGPVSVREQSDLGSAKQVMDQVVGRISGNVPPDWQFFDDGYREEPCRLTVVRDGRRANRSLRLSGPPATESDALTHIASAVGQARLKPVNGPAESFYADAGTFVSVRGQVEGPGAVVVELSSGCRPQ